MTATTVPIVCVSHKSLDSIVVLLRQRQHLFRPLSPNATVNQWVALLDSTVENNHQIVQWLVSYIPAELLAQAAQVAAGGEG